MIPYIGDFAEDETIYHYFNTFSSNDPAASVTITTLADTDIYVYKDGSVTNLVTDGASVVIDFDARTGVHKLTIDTSIHADYAIGSDYMVLIEGTTIDAGNVTAGVFTFSIENRYNDVNVVSVSGTAQTANDNGADINAILVDTGTTIPGQITALNDVAATDIVSSGAITTLAGAVVNVDLVDTTTTNTDMRGTDSANTTAPDNASIAAILTDTGTSIPAQITGLNDIAATDIVSAGAITTLTGSVVSVDLVDVTTTNTDMRGTDSANTTTPPTVGAIADQVWDEAISGHVIAGSTGEALGGATAPTAAVVADAVWDEVLSGHLTSGTTGNALNAAGSAGDPWSTSLPGAYGAGTAGKIIGDNINAPLSTIDGIVDAILVDTGTSIPADIAALNDFNPAVDVVARVTLTDTTTTNTDMRGTDSSYTGTPPTATENADALLNRDMSAVSDTTARSPLNALRMLRNKYSITGTTLTVYGEDDTTSKWTAALSTDAAADPVTGSDPA